MVGYAPRDTHFQGNIMGRGDKKTTKGKRYAASYGNARPQSATKVTAAKAPAVKAPVAKAPAKKAAKKAAAK